MDIYIYTIASRDYDTISHLLSVGKIKTIAVGIYLEKDESSKTGKCIVGKTHIKIQTFTFLKQGSQLCVCVLLSHN